MAFAGGQHVTLWESDKGLTAPERRILVSRLVSEANKEALANDDARVGCFERTGMLLTLDGSDDDKIGPQGECQVHARQSPSRCGSDCQAG